MRNEVTKDTRFSILSGKGSAGKWTCVNHVTLWLFINTKCACGLNILSSTTSPTKQSTIKPRRRSEAEPQIEANT